MGEAETGVLGEVSMLLSAGGSISGRVEVEHVLAMALVGVGHLHQWQTHLAVD